MAEPHYRPEELPTIYHDENGSNAATTLHAAPPTTDRHRQDLKPVNTTKHPERGIRSTTHHTLKTTKHHRQKPDGAKDGTTLLPPLPFPATHQRHKATGLDPTTHHLTTKDTPPPASRPTVTPHPRSLACRKTHSRSYGKHRFHHHSTTTFQLQHLAGGTKVQHAVGMARPADPCPLRQQAGIYARGAETCARRARTAGLLAALPGTTLGMETQPREAAAATARKGAQ